MDDDEIVSALNKEVNLQIGILFYIRLAMSVYVYQNIAFSLMRIVFINLIF